jgi:hypothetical protein
MLLSVVTFLIEMLGAIPVFLLWLVVVALIVRPFGVRMPLGPFEFRRRTEVLHSLTFSQYLAIGGILYFGCGMLIMTTLSRYLDWKYFHGSTNILTERELLGNALQWILAGVLFGLLSFFSGSHARFNR